MATPVLPLFGALALPATVKPALERMHVIVGMATESQETHLQVRQELERDHRMDRTHDWKLREDQYFRFDFDGVGDVDLVGR